MQKPDYIPAGYKRIKVVSSLSALFNEKFGGPDEVNCVLFPRRLSGDFNKLAKTIESEVLFKNIFMDLRRVNFPELKKSFCSLSQPEKIAAELVLADFHLLENEYQRLCDQKVGRVTDTQLRLLKQYTEPGKIIWAPEAFHTDGDRSSLGRILCCYNDPVTEWIRNEDVEVKRSDNGNLLPKKNAQIFSFHAGDIWRMAADGGGYDVPFFIHRSPPSKIDNPPRLLLVGGMK